MSNAIVMIDDEIAGAISKIEKRDIALANAIRELLRVGDYVFKVKSVMPTTDGGVVIVMTDRAGLEFQQTLAPGRSIDPTTGDYSDRKERP